MNFEEQNLNQEPIDSLDTLDVMPSEPTLTVDPVIESGIMPDINSVPPYEEPKESPKKKKMNIKLIIILILLVLAIGAFVTYQIFMNNPYNIYKTIIAETFNEGRAVLENQADLSKPVYYSGNAKVESNIEGAEDLNKYSYNYGLGLDAKNNKMELMVGLNENDKTILDAFAYLLNDNLYLKSDKLYDKLILLGEANVNLSEILESYKPEDTLYLYDKLEAALINALSKEDFTTSSTKININGKSVKVKDNCLVITSQNIGKIIERFVNTFKNDAKAMDILASISGATKEDLTKAFDELISEDFSGEGAIRISVYTKPFINKIVGYSVKLDDEEIIKASLDNEKGKVEVIMDTLVMTFDINGDVTNYTIVSAGETLASGTITITDSETKIDFIIEGVTLNVVYSLKEESNTVSTQKFSVSMSMPEENITIKVTLNNKIEIGKSISNIDTSGAKAVGQMTESELEEILTKLEKILEPTSIYDLLEGLLSGASSLDFDSSIGTSDVKANVNCENATCTNCSWDTCECEYYDNTFTLHKITCPNNTYY